MARLRFLKLTLRGLSAGVLLTDPLRAWHLKQGNVIACVSPKAAGHYRKLCRLYGVADLAGRVAVVPHAVETRFHFRGEMKHRQVVCVGRWQDVAQKRPWLLMDVISALVATDKAVSVVIAGQETPGLEAWHRALDETQRDRVRLRGRVNRDGLAEILRQSQVFYSPSAFESFGIAAAEALCSGCSVVAGRSVSLASFEWFVAENSGTLADEDLAQSHVRALLRELHDWQLGQRDPEHISMVWSDRLHADKVARQIVDFK